MMNPNVQTRMLVTMSALFLWTCLPLSAEGQSLVPAEHEQEPASWAAQGDVPDPITPRGAFIRSIIIPGWGHAAVGAHGRGGAYFLLHSASVWMVFQSHSLRGAARDLRRMEEASVEAELLADGWTDPAEIRQAVANDPRVEGRQELVETRAQQIEDWAALAIFLVLLAGTDAFVSAHLADFPEPLSVRVRPGVGAGRMELGVSVPDHIFPFRR